MNAALALLLLSVAGMLTAGQQLQQNTLAAAREFFDINHLLQ